VGDVRRGDKVNMVGWEMTRAEPRRQAQATCDGSQQCHGEGYGSGHAGGCPGWAGAAVLT